MDLGINPKNNLTLLFISKFSYRRWKCLEVTIFCLKQNPFQAPGNGRFCSPYTNYLHMFNKKHMFTLKTPSGHGAGPSAASVSNMDTLAAIKATWVWVLGLDLKTHCLEQENHPTKLQCWSC